MSEELITTLRHASDLARIEYGVMDILQPGIVREIIMADILGHHVLPAKNGADATDDHGKLFEYLTSLMRPGKSVNSGCLFQLARLTEDNTYRITRNETFYFGVFTTPFSCVAIWRVDTDKVLSLVRSKMNRSLKRAGHVSIFPWWVKQSGELVFQTIT